MKMILGVCHQECILRVFPGYGGTQQVRPDQGQVLDPDQHMEMQRTPGLELKTIEVCYDISLHGLLAVPKS